MTADNVKAKIKQAAIKNGTAITYKMPVKKTNSRGIETIEQSGDTVKDTVLIFKDNYSALHVDTSNVGYTLNQGNYLLLEADNPLQKDMVITDELGQSFKVGAMNLIKIKGIPAMKTAYIGEVRNA
jgi:hypothetical protein